jgi:ribonucleoside-triphosphate reductase
MSEMAKNNHLNNEIYIHDLDHYAIGDHNCLSIPFDKLLANGFKTRQTDVRPAGSINTAMQLVAVIFQLQSLQQFGGVSATHLDWTMVPYVRKSFYKHYKEGLYWFGNDKYLESITNETSIDDEKYKLNQNAYEYALRQTEKETHQAVEALYHNLNY